ncbi:alpha-N-acetylgalactosaminide alpha-2,6-sialyltransferase 5-like [Denticeps clupeoides]|uniref:Alpha-N-acetylgalactosaminide alpha-2,6-sialyltransferase 5 n=1 Tax=Denticeps clupeoides TaxID=299321 RepID=A0A8C4AJ37_9TELE|nr:alpha-N-acetylgalactosaminide alpha-2,6-sialyltransferase 5-like [Denticeps clupeoides]XP_028833722.1 alpha-N-acetylgalactosaminide alpha-2,6-sialyltransferase 5-like [Denticeps clupeoides]
MKTATRHRLAVFGAVTMFTSVLLLYSGSFSGASTGSGDKTDAPARTHRAPAAALQGYSSIRDHKPLKMHCSSCSLVTSSGHLTGSGRGHEIDSSECVIRMNDAPTARGYGQDVGRRTSLRVIAHSSMQRVLRSSHELLNSSQDTVFIFWGPSSYMRRDGKGLVYNNLRLMNQVLPKLKVYIISWQKMQQFDELFKRETGKDRRISNSWLSTGWFTMTIALELCDRINIYGMVPPDFCPESQHPSVPYHYYEPMGPDECSMYISHERGRRGSHHRFITEKRVFSNWARTFNIHFYQPDWSPPPLPRNSSAAAPVPAAPSAPPTAKSQ